MRLATKEPMVPRAHWPGSFPNIKIILWCGGYPAYKQANMCYLNFQKWHLEICAMMVKHTGNRLLVCFPECWTVSRFAKAVCSMINPCFNIQCSADIWNTMQPATWIAHNPQNSLITKYICHLCLWQNLGHTSPIVIYCSFCFAGCATSSDRNAKYQNEELRPSRCPHRWGYWQYIGVLNSILVTVIRLSSLHPESCESSSPLHSSLSDSLQLSSPSCTFTLL